MIEHIALGVLGISAAVQGITLVRLHGENDRLWALIQDKTVRSTPKPFTRTRKD